MSKYRREETPSLPKHRHCHFCGTPIELSKEYCSEKCRLDGKRISRSKMRKFILITAIVLIFYLVVILGFR